MSKRLHRHSSQPEGKCLSTRADPVFPSARSRVFSLVRGRILSGVFDWVNLWPLPGTALCELNSMLKVFDLC